MVTTQEIATAFKDVKYFNTFGGNPVSCIVGLTVLEIIEEENLQHNALKVSTDTTPTAIDSCNEVGEHLKSRLDAIHRQHTQIIGHVRGQGLFIGVEFREAEHARHIFETLKDRYAILCGKGGRGGTVLRIKPPICFSLTDANTLADALSEILNEYT